MIRHCVTYRIIQHISPFTEHERVRRAVQLFVRESGAPQVKQFNRRRSKLSKRLIDKLRARDVTKRTHGGQSRVRNARFPRRITDRITRSNPIQSNRIQSRLLEIARLATIAPHPHPHPRLRAPSTPTRRTSGSSRARCLNGSNVPRVVPRASPPRARRFLPTDVLTRTSRVASSTGVVVVSIPRSSSPFVRRVALDVPAVPVPRRDADADASSLAVVVIPRVAGVCRDASGRSRDTPLNPTLNPTLNPISTLSQP